MKTVLMEFGGSRDLSKKYMMQVEAFLRLRVKPRPKWLPARVHRWLLNKLVVLEERV